MNALAWAALALAALAYLSAGIFIGCSVKGDREGVGRLAVGFAAVTAIGAATLWWIAGRG